MKICTNCGKKIPENTMFCPICGAKNDKFLPYASVVGPQTAALYAKPGAFSFSGRARRSEYWTVAILGGIYNIFVLIAFLMLLSDGGENVGQFLIVILFFWGASSRYLVTCCACAPIA
ncbi:MAG: zinc-ribbon domain-containing protein [Kiritimatiellia bacterium]